MWCGETRKMTNKQCNSFLHSPKLRRCEYFYLPSPPPLSPLPPPPLQCFPPSSPSTISIYPSISSIHTLPIYLSKSLRAPCYWWDAGRRQQDTSHRHPHRHTLSDTPLIHPHRHPSQTPLTLKFKADPQTSPALPLNRP